MVSTKNITGLVVIVVLVIVAGYYFSSTNTLQKQVKELNNTVQQISEDLEQKESSLSQIKRDKDNKISELESDIKELKEEKKILENRGVIFSDFGGWQGVSGGGIKYIFSINVYNGGNTEAKDIEVICGIQDGSSKEWWFAEKREVGNLASHSSDNFRLTLEPPKFAMGEDTGACYAIGCKGDCYSVNNNIDRVKENVEDMQEALDKKTTTSKTSLN